MLFSPRSNLQPEQCDETRTSYLMMGDHINARSRRADICETLFSSLHDVVVDDPLADITIVFSCGD